MQAKSFKIALQASTAFTYIGGCEQWLWDHPGTSQRRFKFYCCHAVLAMCYFGLVAMC